MPQMEIVIRFTPQEFFLLKEAMDELCNDSDLIWGGPDDHSVRYDAAMRLAARLEQIEQTVVIPH
jgi:hypothetical protein